MKYLFVFILMFALSLGFLTLLTSFFYFKKKSRITFWFIFFLISFFLLIIDSIIFEFLRIINFENQSLYFSLFIISHIIAILLNSSLFILTVYILKIEYRKSVWIFFFFVLTFIIFLIISFIIFNANNYNIRTIDLTHYVYYLLPLICSFPVFLSYKRINHEIFKIFRTIFISYLFFLPFLLLENMNITIDITIANIKRIKISLILYPVYYIIFNIILLLYGLKYMFKNKNNSSTASNFIENFKITEREKGIIELMILGYSNKEIAQKLNISIATVRNHLHNIFEKTGASNRTELARFYNE